MISDLLMMLGRVRELRRNERMSRLEFEAMKLEKFRKLVLHACEKSPYYAQLVRERSIDPARCVPQDFPVLTKSMLMSNFDSIVTDRRITKALVADFLTRSKDPNEFLLGDYRVLHTSGSSGEVGYFLYSEREWLYGMTQGFGRRASRPRPKKKGFGRWRMAYYAAVGGHFAGVSMVSSMRRGVGRWFVDLRLLEVNSPLPAVLDELNAYQPHFLSGYTTALKILAAKQREGALRLSVQAIGTGGEPMTPSDKAYLEESFGCEATSAYGCTEHLMMGGSNPDGLTMTLFDHDLIYEFFDDHVLVTNLFNYTMPLIRYRMSDVLRPIPGAKSPHNPNAPFLVIDTILGRAEQMPFFVNRDGQEDFIHPISVVELFIDGVSRFQMRVVDRTSFRFLVCLDPKLSDTQRAATLEATRRRLREFLNQKLMDNVVFEVVAVPELSLDPKTGKFKLIVFESRAQ